MKLVLVLLGVFLVCFGAQSAPITIGDIYGDLPPALPPQGELIDQGHISSLGAYYQRHRLTLKHNQTPFKNFDIVILSRNINPSQNPTLLFLNKCGNHTLFKSLKLEASVYPEQKKLCPDPMNKSGWRQKYWQMNHALDQELTLVSFHETAIAPDDPSAFASHLKEWPPQLIPKHSQPGLIALWAWGLKQVVSYLRAERYTQPLGVFGHSRRGKAALLAAALDPQIDFVIGHQTGTLGAVGVQGFPAESLSSILYFFPHWFTPKLNQWQATEVLFNPAVLYRKIYPRPILISEGYFDPWASPWISLQTLEKFAQDKGLKANQVSYPIRFPLKSLTKTPLINAHGPYKHTMHADYWALIGHFTRRYFEPDKK